MINKLPPLSDPVKYAGLYIFDFGDRVSVGYTAEEIEFLLADSRYARGGVYKIYRVGRDGTLEIRGVTPLAWTVLTGIVFWFEEVEQALTAFDLLKNLASAAGPPGEFDLFMVRKPGSECTVAMVMRYSQELDDAMAAWLLKIKFNSGKYVEAGNRVVAQILMNSTELVSERLGADEFRKSRTRQEVLDTVDRNIQR